MTLAKRLEETWRVLEAGADGPLIRTLDEFDASRGLIQIGIDSSGCRELIVQLEDPTLRAEASPVAGVRLVLRKTTTESVVTSQLVIRCSSTRFHRVFTHFAASVLEEMRGRSDPARAAVQTLLKWQEMFLRVARRGSESQLRGIYGELHELQILSRVSTSAAAAWLGPERAPQDFIRSPVALEVKSTRSHTNQVEIHGIEQLWAEPYSILGMVVKQIGTDPGGQSVPELLDELVDLGVDSTVLREKLSALEIDVEELESAPRFVHRASRYFRVTANTPALTPSRIVGGTLPAGISEVSYVLALDGDGLEPMPDAEINELHNRLAK